MDKFEPKYLLMIGLGLGLSAVIYFLNGYVFLKDSVKNKIKVAVGIFCCAICAVASAFLLNYLLNPLAYGLPFEQISGLIFHTFYAVTFFFLYAYIMLRLLKLQKEKYLNAMVPSVILGASVAKIGCVFAECCGGITSGQFIIPTAEIEACFGILIFIIFQFFTKSNKLPKYILVYAPFRFIMEFLRARTHSVVLFDTFKPEQILALVLCFIIAIYILNIKFRSGVYEKRKS